MAKDELTFTHGKNTKIVLRPPGAKQRTIMLAIGNKLQDFGNAAFVFSWHMSYVESCTSKAFEWPALTLRDCANFDAVMTAWEQWLNGPANDVEFTERLGDEIGKLLEPADEDLAPTPPPESSDPKAASGGKDATESKTESGSDAQT